jgi:hypothetical protein
MCTELKNEKWSGRLDTEQRLEEAVQSYWDARQNNAEKQKKGGKIDAGTRGEVTGGTQMGALEVLVSDILCDAGLKQADVAPALRWSFPAITDQRRNGT